jgi:hypothetical protein
VPAEGEADIWVPVRDEAYLCSSCQLLEACLSNAKDAYVEFRNRWNDPIVRDSPELIRESQRRRDRQEEDEARAWTWPHEWAATEGPHALTDRPTRAQKLHEDRQFDEYTIGSVRESGLTLPKYKYDFPVGEEYVAAVLADPDLDAPRWDYARWLRSIGNETASCSADFIEWQLRLAESVRDDPRADIKQTLPDRPFSSRVQDHTYLPDVPWWRYPGACGGFFLSEPGLGESTRILENEGLIDDTQFFRGFVEHVAIKAVRFLEIADELYSLAPVRHLTITYCKGLDHQDQGLLKAVLESPHLDRIRALKLPVRKFGWDKGDHTELNRLTDSDVEMIAASQRLRGLASLDLEDQKRLTIGAFDALAASSNLPALSAVRHDINRYWYPGSFSFGTVGKQVRELASRPLHDYAPELEARHGRIPWLHVAESYGTESPDPEAIVEHPVALDLTPVKRG